MRTRLLFLALPGLLVLLAVPYFFLPTILENRAARGLQDQLGLEERPEVELESDPQWEMFLGEFSGGKVSIGATDLGDVRADGVTMDLDAFSVDLIESLRSPTVVAREPISGRVRAEVSEDEVSRLVRQNADMPVKGVGINADGVTVRSEASVLGATFPVIVEGGVGAEDGNLVFRPRTVKAAGIAVPGPLADTLLEGAAFRYPVRDLPYGTKITGARAGEEVLVLDGKVSGVELGAG